MIGAELKDVRDRISRWVEDTQSQFPLLLGLLDSYGRLQERVEAAERGNERLHDVAREPATLRERAAAAEHECERLRGEVSHLQAEMERGAQERVEIAERLTRVINEAVLRLRPAQP
jgi:predicted nuclease with TOPRIM domain